MDDEPRHEGHDEASRNAPLWVKAFGAVALVFVLVVLLLLLVGSGHGPGRHSAPGANGQTG